MKYVLPVLLAAMLASAAPAMADHDHGRGEGRGAGGWHGGGGEQRGGNGEGRGGRWNGGQGGQGPVQSGRGGGPEGRWNGGYPAGPEPGPIYAAPPRPRGGSEYYRGEQDEARDGVRSGSIKPMGWVVGRLERSRAGRMLDAQLEQGPSGRPVYRVIWAGADGRRSDIIIDAQTGAVLQGY